MGLKRDSYPSMSLQEILSADVLTVGMIAKLCRVSSRTVTHWFDCGKLKGFRVPTNSTKSDGFRRVMKKDVITFLSENGMGDLVPITVVGCFGVPRLVAELCDRTQWAVRTWRSPMEIHTDNVIISEFWLGAGEGLELAKLVYDWCKKQKIKTTYIADEDGYRPQWAWPTDCCDIDEFLRRTYANADGKCH